MALEMVCLPWASGTCFSQVLRGGSSVAGSARSPFSKQMKQQWARQYSFNSVHLKDVKLLKADAKEDMDANDARLNMS